MAKHLIGQSFHIGARSEQQDFYGTHDLPGLGEVYIVCDGMGGMAGGALASENATKIVIKSLSEAIVKQPEIALENAIQFANSQIYDYAQRNPELKGMGTTLTALLLHRDKAVVCHVGDSRVYQIRDGKKVFRTNDHSKVFEEFVLTGSMNEEEARLYPKRNVITRALGIGPQVYIETKILPYVKGDRFALCTDGVWEAMPEEALLQSLSQKKSNLVVADELLRQIVSLNKPDQDNMALLLVDCTSNSTIQPPIEMKTKVLIGALAVLALLNIPSFIFMQQYSTKIDELVAQNKDLNEKVADLQNTTTAQTKTEEPATTTKEQGPVDKKEPNPTSSTGAGGKQGRPSNDGGKKKGGSNPKNDDTQPQAPSTANPPATVVDPPPATTSPAPTSEQPKVEQPKEEVKPDSLNKGGKQLGYRTYTVKKGDTLYNIAKNHGVTMSDIKKKIPA